MPAQTDPLLTTALEKLLYLESRLDSAEAGREEAARERDRQRSAAQAARQALAEWQKRATAAEIAAEGAERESSLLREALTRNRQPNPPAEPESDLAARLQEAEERLARFERERETWLDRMVMLGRLHRESDDLDLGSFIAELRAELLALRRGDQDRRRATIGDRPVPPDPEQILEQAPSGPLEIDVDGLLQRARLSRPERTLASICARDLKSASALVRRRAVERLTEGGIHALAPLAVSMLSFEPDPHVRIALLKLLETAGGETSDLALTRALGDADARVRATALEAVARRLGSNIEAALQDPDPAIRRRALALLPRTPSAVEHLATALRDTEASVRHVAALALTRYTGTEAEALLQVAAQSADAEVNTVARDALRKRNIAMPVLTEAAVSAPEPEPPPALPGLAEQIEEELRRSLRGRTPAELAGRLGADPAEAEEVIQQLVEAQILVRRGQKLYLT